MNSTNNKFLAGIIGVFLLIVVFIVIMNSQQQSPYVYIPPQPQWRIVETFSIRAGESHMFTCPHSHWKIEWELFQVTSSNPVATLYCGIGLNPSEIDSLHGFSSNGFKEYSNLPCEGGYTLEITGEQGLWVIYIMAYY